MSEGAPRVEEIFNRALAAQLAEQQAQRDAFSDIERRLAEIERQVTETNVNGAGDALVDEVVEERLRLLEGSVRSDDSVDDRLASIERALEEGLSSIRTELVESTERRLQAIQESIGSRLGEMEVAVRELQEATHTRLDDLQEAHLAAETGILERIIAESQIVGAVFEAVRPAVEAAAQVGPELENTLEELRQIAENVQSSGDSAESPYSADELNAPHEDEEKHESLFLPPEETPIPERRFLRRDK